MTNIKEGYKETEIGVIPEDWEIDFLDNLAQRLTGHTPNKKIESYWGGEIPWVSLKDTFRLDKGYVYETTDYTTIDGINNSSAVLLQEGTVIISRDATVGKVGITATEMATSQHFINYVCGKSLNNKYLYYTLLNRKDEFVRIAIGSTIKTIGMPYFKALKVIVPPLPEQQRIAEILSTTDSHIEKLDETIEDYQVLKKGMMKKLLTEGIGHTEFKDSEIGRIPKDWEVKKIEDIAEILDSKRKPLNSSERNAMKGDIPYYGANGVVDYVNNFLFDDDLILLAEDGGNFSDYANRAIAYRVTGKSWVNNHAHILKPLKNVEFDWFFYSLQHKDITGFIQGGTRAKLNQKDLRRIIIAIPPKEEQIIYSKGLIDIDERISLFVSEREDLIEFKKALMEKLLTGKIRIV